MIRRPSTGFLIYLATLSVAGALVLHLATSRMGPGVSTDSAIILSTAENLIRGNGLIDYLGRELTQFPPLYSVILAFGSAILGADVFVVGWVLNGLVFAALIAVTGLYLHEAFDEEPILACAGSFVVLTSTSLLQISANVASDPLFMLMVMGFLMIAGAYLRTGETRFGVMAGILTAVSCFQRYAGLALVLAGGLIALYAHRRRIVRGATAAALFVLMSAAPIYAWGYLHNKPYNGTVFGGRLPPVATLNFENGLEKVLYWFIPHRLISALGEVPLLAIVVGLAGVLVLLTGIRRFADKLQRPLVIASLAFLVVYGSVLVFNISTFELKRLTADRVHVVALPAVLLLLSAFGSQLLEVVKTRNHATLLRGLLLAVFLAWSIYPISKSIEYVRASMTRGDVSAYNSINKSDIRVSSLARYLRQLDLAENQLYSNGGDTVWFILRTRVQALPIFESDEREAELHQRYADWPAPRHKGYIVWITAEAHKTNYATPEELSQIADVTQLYGDDTGSVYAVTAR